LRELVPARSVLHKLVLEERNDFVMYAVGALHGVRR